MVFTDAFAFTGLPYTVLLLLLGAVHLEAAIWNQAGLKAEAQDS